MLKRKRKSFVATIEVMVTLVLITMMSSLTLYSIRVMDVQRYMNTVLTNSIAEASRWGGFDTLPYQNNVGGGTILGKAQNDLNRFAPDFHPKITGSPNKIGSTTVVQGRIDYHLPPVYGTISNIVSPSTGEEFNMYEGVRNLHMQSSAHSIMQPGILLG